MTWISLKLFPIKDAKTIQCFPLWFSNRHNGVSLKRLFQTIKATVMTMPISSSTEEIILQNSWWERSEASTKPPLPDSGFQKNFEVGGWGEKKKKTETEPTRKQLLCNFIIKYEIMTSSCLLSSLSDFTSLQSLLLILLQWFLKHILEVSKSKFLWLYIPVISPHAAHVWVASSLRNRSCPSRLPGCFLKAVQTWWRKM